MCAFVSKRFVGTGSVCRKVLLCAAVLVFAASGANAEDHVWSSLGGGSFNYWLNWVPNFVPGEDDRAIFELGMNPAYEVTFYASATTLECLFRTDKVVFNLGGCTYTLANDGFALTVGEDYGHVAEVVMYNGTLAASRAHIGLWEGSTGRLDLESGASLNISDAITVGNDGNGLMNVSGSASVTADYVTVAGHDFGNIGTLNIDGPNVDFTVNEILRVGDSGHGYLNLLNGGGLSTQGCYIGDSSSGHGEVSLTGASEFTAGDWVVCGGCGPAVLYVTEASQFDTVFFYAGSAPTGSATIDVIGADSRIDASDLFIVGDWGQATMNVSQQAAVTAHTLVVGACETGDGEVNVSDAGATVSVLHSIQSGSHGVGAINITGGADVRTTADDGPIYVGLGEGGNGHLLVDGGSTLVAERSALVIGDSGHGVMDILGGSEVHTGNELFMGWCEGSFGQLTISGAGSKYTIDTGYPAQVGDGGEGTLIIAEGGHFEKPGGFRLGLQSTGVGAVTLNGSESRFRCGEHLGVGEYGVGTYTVNDGRVAVGNVELADVPSGEVYVGDWGKLTGTGTLIGDVVNFNNGSVRPGGEPAGTQTGVFTIDGDYTQEDAELRVRIKGLTAGDEYSVLAVTGAAQLGGRLELQPVEDFVMRTGQQFTIMTFGSRTGEFASINGPGQYDVTYNANDVTVTVLSPAHPGDLDCDGSVSNFDVDPFILALISSQNGVPEEYYDVYPDCDIMLADLNADGSITLFDVDPFVDMLTRK